MFERAVYVSLCHTVMSNVAFKAGSSKQGNTPLASVGHIWVAATILEKIKICSIGIIIFLRYIGVDVKAVMLYSIESVLNFFFIQQPVALGRLKNGDLMQEIHLKRFSFPFLLKTKKIYIVYCKTSQLTLCFHSCQRSYFCKIRPNCLKVQHISLMSKYNFCSWLVASSFRRQDIGLVRISKSYLFRLIHPGSNQ